MFDFHSKMADWQAGLPALDFSGRSTKFNAFFPLAGPVSLDSVQLNQTEVKSAAE